METADAMFAAGRYMYAIFMCHLSIEKALKGLYHKRLNDLPPKVHNLLYFVEKLRLDLPNELLEFAAVLNNVSVPTRYPDDLQRIITDFTEAETSETLKRGKDVLQWLKTAFEK